MMKLISVATALLSLTFVMSACQTIPTSDNVNDPTTVKAMNPHDGQEQEVRAVLDSIHDLPIKRSPSSIKTIPVSKKFTDYPYIKIPRNASWLGDEINIHGGTLGSDILIRSTLPNLNIIWSGFDVERQNRVKDTPLTFISGKTTYQALLDSIAYQLDIAYRIEGKTIIFQPTITVPIRIATTPGNRKAVLKSFSELENDLEFEHDPYLEAQRIARVLLGETVSESQQNNISTAYSPLPSGKPFANNTAGNGASDGRRQTKVALSLSSNTLYVTGTLNQIRQIESALESFNRAVQQSVRLKFNMYIVSVNDSKQQGIDWNFLYNSHNASANVSSSIGNLNTLSSPFTFTLAKNLGSLAGSNFIFNHLREQGDTQVITHPVVITKNNEVTDLSSARVRTYIDSLEQTATASEGVATVSTNFNKEEFIDGLSLWILPTIQNRRINLLIGLRYQDLESLSIERFDGGLQTTLPQFTRANFRIPSEIENGETLVIAGIKLKKTQSGQRSGHGFWGKLLDPLIKGENGNENSREVVVTITAELT